MEIKRRRFQGVLNILSFNRHFYIIGLIILGLLFLIHPFFNLSIYLKKIILLLFIYGLIAPLLISAYVYDFSKYYDFNWLKKLNLKDTDKNKILNINAGFDETSFILKSKFPKSRFQVFDFYDRKKHTELAIKRARKVSLVYPNTKTISTNRIPIESESINIVFLLSAAHEIRNNKEKIIFFKECRRVLKKDGKIIVVEHLRDLPNFIAFSIGFTHFFSKRTWRNVFKKAQLYFREEKKFTPFLSIFSYSKSNSK
jgi:SAM-dependent methyltransferase